MLGFRSVDSVGLIRDASVVVHILDVYMNMTVIGFLFLSLSVEFLVAHIHFLPFLYFSKDHILQCVLNHYWIHYHKLFYFYFSVLFSSLYLSEL